MALSAAILTIVLALSMVRPLSADAASTTFAAAAERIVSDTNAFRAEHGLAAVSLDAAISADVAQPWAEQMAKSGSFEHNPNVSEGIPSGWSAWGENIAYGFDATDVVAAWIASPEHRANLLGGYNRLGIGFAVDASGTAWLVQDFADYAKARPQASGTTTASASSADASGSQRASKHQAMTTRASVSRGAAVSRRGKRPVRIHGLKVRNANTSSLRVSGGTKAHSTLRVRIDGPRGADTTRTVHTDRHGRFAMVWHGSRAAGTYAITVRFVANARYAPAYTKWSMRFVRTR